MKHAWKCLAILGLTILAATACQKDIPVNWIEIEPAKATMFVGESRPLTITCLPEDATNLDELEVYSTNEYILTWENGMVTARDEGRAAISATCGDVVAQSVIRVYKDKFIKGNSTYGIDYATGYQYLMGTGTVQELDIVLVHKAEDGSTQNFKVWVTSEQLGHDLDYTKPVEGSFVGVYANNNEDGYFVYSSAEGTPFIVEADWTFTDLTVRRGILRVDHISGLRYKIHADFELSNGYAFSTDWEGLANMSTE